MCRVWRNGRCVATLQGHRPRGVWRCVPLPGGRVATAGADATIKLWALADFGVQPVLAPSLAASLGGCTGAGAQRRTTGLADPGQMPDLAAESGSGAEAVGSCASPGAQAGSARWDVRSGADSGVPGRVEGSRADGVCGARARVRRRHAPGVEALALDYSHLGAAAAAAQAARAAAGPGAELDSLHRVCNSAPGGAAVGVAEAGRAAAASVAAGPEIPEGACDPTPSTDPSSTGLSARDCAGASGSAVLFRGAGGGAAAESVRCLGFPAGEPDPGVLYLATQHGVLHRVHLPAAERPALWQRLWACPCEGHATCLAVRAAQPCALENSPEAAAAEGVSVICAPPPGLLSEAGAAEKGRHGCQGSPRVGLMLYGEHAISDMSPPAPAADWSVARDAVLLGGFSGWAACVWAPPATDPSQALVFHPAPNGASFPAAGRVPGVAQGSSSDTPGGLADVGGKGGGHGVDTPGGGGLGSHIDSNPITPLGVEGSCWQAHPGSPISRVLWLPELGPRFAATLDSSGALRVWRLPAPQAPHATKPPRVSPGFEHQEGQPQAATRQPPMCDAQHAHGPAGGAVIGFESGSWLSAGPPELWAEAHSPFGEPLTCAAAAPQQQLVAAGDAVGSVLLFNLPPAGVLHAWCARVC